MSKQRQKIVEVHKVTYVVSLGDWHIPDHSERAIEATLSFCRYVKPQIIILHEMLDAKAISKFQKSPMDAIGLQKEIDICKEYLKRIRRQHPKAKILLLDSNHQDRIQTYLETRAPELSVLDCLKVDKLLGLKELNIKSVPDFKYKNVLFMHGRIVKKDSGASAKASVESEGMSTIIGHVHRGGTYYVRKRGASFVGVEGGCLSKLNPSYIKGTANWTNGFSMVEFHPNGRYHAQFIPIYSGKIIYGKKTFGGK